MINRDILKNIKFPALKVVFC